MLQIDKRLADAGHELAEEIRAGRWSHVTDYGCKPEATSLELIAELERRCPGHSVAEYQRALADGMFASR